MASGLYHENPVECEFFDHTGCPALTRGCVSARPALRATQEVKGLLGSHESPLIDAFLPLSRSVGEPVAFIRRAQVHDPLSHK
jgi:hypothetical protein